MVLGSVVFIDCGNFPKILLRISLVLKEISFFRQKMSSEHGKLRDGGTDAPMDISLCSVSLTVYQFKYHPLFSYPHYLGVLL